MSAVSEVMTGKAKAMCATLQIPATEGTVFVLVDEFTRIHQAAIELAIKRAFKAWPRAHTYASENADAYRAQDRVRDAIVKSLEDYLANIRRPA